MSTSRRVIPLIAAICLMFHACGPSREESPPFAAMSVTLSRHSVPAGHLIDVTYRFVVAPDAAPTADEHMVFIHVIDEYDGEPAWADDHAPPISTAQWKPGDVIEYSRPLFVSTAAYQGRFSIHAGLYSPRTGGRLPLAATPVSGRSYRLAGFDVTRGPTPPVAFLKGWHSAERGGAPGSVPGREWHWSEKREALLWCPHPGRDARFVLHVDQPLAGEGMSREVQVRVGGATVDTFEVQPGSPVVRRIPLSAVQLGSDEVVPITIVVDRTVVPAAMPDTGSSDPRELGVRVLDAFLEARQ